MKLSKGRIRHLHKTKEQSRRNHAKTKEVARRHNLSHKNKTPVNLRSLTLKNAVIRPKHKRRNLNTFASRLDKRMAHYGVGGEPKKEKDIIKKEEGEMQEATETKADKKQKVDAIVNDVSDGLKKAKERKAKLETMTASERFDRLKTYMKTTVDSIKMGKKLESILSAMTRSPFNLNSTIDEFYSSRTKYYVNDFKGDILAMFESVKKDINGMLSSLDWNNNNFILTIQADGKPEKLNFFLLYVIMRQMFCIDLLNSLIVSSGTELVNAKSMKYLQSCLQATLQLMFVNTAPSNLVSQQNELFGEKAGSLWDMKNKDIIWGQSDYDTHEKISSKVDEQKAKAIKEGGDGENVDVIHGNFVKTFMQKLSTGIITNIKETQTSAPPKQSELMLHNNQIYNDIKNAITSLLFNVLFNYTTFETTQSGGFAEVANAIGQLALGLDAHSNAMMSRKKAKERQAMQTQATASNLPQSQVKEKPQEPPEEKEEQLTGTGMEKLEKKEKQKKPIPFSGDYEKISREKEAAREEEQFKLVSALLNSAKKEFEDKGHIDAARKNHLDKEYKKFMIYSEHPKVFGFKSHTWPEKFLKDAKQLEVNYDDLMQRINEHHEPTSLTTDSQKTSSFIPNDKMERLNKIPINTPPVIHGLFSMMLFVDPTSWSPLLLPSKKPSKSMKVYMDTWAKHGLGKIKAVKKVLLSSKNLRINDSLEFQNGDYDERQIQVVVYKPPEDATHNPPHYDIRVMDPELTATQFFNALSTKYPDYLGAPVPARLSPENDKEWQNIELGDPKKAPALKKTTADWIGPDMNSALSLDAPEEPVSQEVIENKEPSGFVKDVTLLPGKSVEHLFIMPKSKYFDIQDIPLKNSGPPVITSQLLEYIDNSFIKPGMVSQ
ncbi:MAG: hypothetical protein ACXABD_00390 [Candidatus Thorarchaeota archaeon]|jgi:hypothetical protein